MFLRVYVLRLSPAWEFGEDPFRFEVVTLLRLLVHSGCRREETVSKVLPVNGSCQEFRPSLPPWLFFEFGRVLHLDCPWSPVKK
jgi:hypothetical protein